MGKSTPSEATPAKTRSSKGDPPPAPAPEPEDEGGGSADEVEKELGGGVSEALAEFKAAIGAAGPAPTLGKQDEWRVALAALSLPLLQSVCVEIGVEAGAIVGQTAGVCVEDSSSRRFA